MCNQITLKASVDEVASYFKARRPKPTNASTGDVWKGGTGFVVRESAGERVMDAMTWGFPTQADSNPAATMTSQRAQGHPYAILGTRVFDLTDPASQIPYQIFVSLPPSYEQQPQRRYPTVYVTDADYGFPMLRLIGRRLNGARPQVEEFIIVGLSYEKGGSVANSDTVSKIGLMYCQGQLR